MQDARSEIINPMRVFMSSVRKGLEQERDSLAGIIKAVGHAPVRFEDFSAQNTPSRDACLRELASSDVYLLILGPQYGHKFPETGQSPTHEEWVFATRNGIERIVYRKQGVIFENSQQQLAREIEAYSTGVFRDSFTSVQELQEKVVKKLREIDAQESVLAYERLADPSVRWRDDSQRQGYLTFGYTEPLLEVHVVPVGQANYSVRIMSQLSDSLATRLRRVGYVDSTSALNVTNDTDRTTVEIPVGCLPRHGEVRNGSIAGVRLLMSRQISVWSTLPYNGMASVLDPVKLPAQVANLLRLIGSLEIVDAYRIAVAVGVDPVKFLTVEAFDENRPAANSMSIKHSEDPLRIDPDESVTLSAIGSGADEVAQHLARALIEQWNRRR